MNIIRIRSIFITISVLLVTTIACAMPTTNTSQIPVTAQTRAVETVAALITQAAGQTAAPAQLTPAPTDTAVIPTLLPTSTPLPTPTVVILPTATATTICDQASFVQDVTVPDGTTFPAGSSFTKTWRIRNIGSCTWTTDYAVVFESGNSMNGPASQNITSAVAPGQTVDLSLNLRAPGAPGAYRSNYKLRNAAGVLFGVGGKSGRFYADIQVVSAPSNVNGYDFASNLCLAEWSGNGKTLPCLGKDGSQDGFVLYLKQPVLESGYTDDQPGLVTNPPRVTDGVIRGKFTSYTVRTDDHFRSIVGCEYKAKNCDVRFQLEYQIDNGSIQTLATWHEAYEGKYTWADVDLTSLAGKNVRFILTVFANGASDNDRALWLLPRIEKK